MTTVAWRALAIVAALFALGVLTAGALLAVAVVQQRVEARRQRAADRRARRGDATGWTPDDGLPPWRRP